MLKINNDLLKEIEKTINYFKDNFPVSDLFDSYYSELADHTIGFMKYYASDYSIPELIEIYNKNFFDEKDGVDLKSFQRFSNAMDNNSITIETIKDIVPNIRKIFGDSVEFISDGVTFRD